jgi:hypothetical protein
MERGAVLAAAEFPAGAGDPQGADAHLNAGPFAQATADAVRQAEALPEVHAGTFEVRLLRIAGVYLVALWLKSDGAGEDRLIPLAPAPSELAAGKAYPPAQALDSLRPRAAARRAFRFYP